MQTLHSPRMIETEVFEGARGYVPDLNLRLNQFMKEYSASSEAEYLGWQRLNFGNHMANR